MSTVEKFKAAVDVIRGLPKQGSFQPSSDMQLKFYSFYKQATEGPCRNPKPSFWDVIGKAKWDAWKSLGSMPKEEAMEKYVDELKEVIQILKKQNENGNPAKAKDQIVETMSYTDSVSKFLDLLGPFYESVPLEQVQTTVNGDHGDHDSEHDDVLAKPLPISHTKGERNDPDNSHVNGFGEPGDADSDGDEFSDTYDNIKEPSDDGDGDLTSLPVVVGGGGVSQTLTDSIAGIRECSPDCTLTTNNGLTFNECSFSCLNFVRRSNGHCLEDSPSRHSHPATSPSHGHRALNHDHSYSQPVLYQENENHIWALSREDMTNAVGEFKGGVDGIVQARGGSDQTAVNPRGNSAGSSASGVNVTGRSQRNRLARESGSGNVADQALVPGGSGGSQGGPQHRTTSSDISDQLALAVIKLQHSMDDVNSRLASLEVVLRGANLTPKSPQKKSLRHIFGVSPQLLVLILAWPFLAHWIMERLRKRNH